MAYFVGLDSGGTKTECWLGDETDVLAKAVCGTVKLTRVSQEIATARLRELLAEAEAGSGVSLSGVTRTCVGVAGYSITEVREWAARVVGELVGGEVVVCGDEEIALDAAFRGGPGVLLIGGTGANVVGRAGDGAVFTAGGWGPAIGDEGSGFWIGREAVRRAFRAVDRGVETTLLDGIRVAWGLKDAGEVVAHANAQPGPDFSTLVRVVVQSAESGDALARQILDDAGAELAEQVAVVWGKMRVHGEMAGDVAYTGSVVEKIGRVRESLRGCLERSSPGLGLVDGAVNAMDGAMWRARRG